MAEVFADVEQRRLSIGDWSRRAEWTRHNEGGEWAAAVGLRSRATLQLAWAQGEPVHAVLWMAEPDDSPGGAVVVGSRGIEGIMRIPVCECGEQSCADASFQFRGIFAADDIPALVEMFDLLPAVAAKLSDSNVWRPGDWDAIPRVDWPDTRSA